MSLPETLRTHASRLGSSSPLFGVLRSAAARIEELERDLPMASVRAYKSSVAAAVEASRDRTVCTNCGVRLSGCVSGTGMSVMDDRPYLFNGHVLCIACFGMSRHSDPRASACDPLNDASALMDAACDHASAQEQAGKFQADADEGGA